MYSMTEQLSHQGVLVIRMHARVVAVRIRSGDERIEGPAGPRVYIHVRLP
jgi:hypothetical protein